METGSEERLWSTPLESERDWPLEDESGGSAEFEQEEASETEAPDSGEGRSLVALILLKMVCCLPILLLIVGTTAVLGALYAYRWPLIGLGIPLAVVGLTWAYRKRAARLPVRRRKGT